MSVTTLAGGRKATHSYLLLALIAGAVFAFGLADAFAQNPFGAPRPPAGPPPGGDGIAGWLIAKQAEFYLLLSGAIRKAKTDGSAVWVLMGLSFAYGIFHAAGPGHGKAVISSYLVANEETWKRGVALSFASALVQALVAVLVVGIAAALLGATAKTMNNAVWWIEIASYLLIAFMGARLLYTKGRAFIGEWKLVRAPKTLGAAATVAHALQAHDHSGHHHLDHAHDHDHAHGHDHGGHDHHHHDHAHDRDHHDHAHANPEHGAPGHVHDDHCGHSHGPTPDQLAGPGGWKRGLVAIFAVGLRPCSGAILVLVFALAQGIFWAGIAATFVMGIGTAITVAAIATLTVSATGLAARIAATRTGYGSVALRGIEVAAAAVVLLFGIALLAGYMANERMVGIA
jgi:nickel/cobalt exporter